VVPGIWPADKRSEVSGQLNERALERVLSIRFTQFEVLGQQSKRFVLPEFS